MKIKTSELTGPALDWAVAKCEGLELNGPYACFDGAWCIREPDGSDGDVCPEYSTDWSQGGPIIEREKICTTWMDNFGGWHAQIGDEAEFNAYGPTILIAAMRCYLASKLGDEVKVPTTESH